MDQVGHYQVAGELHRGVHGVVYQAHDLRGGDPIALKAIPLRDSDFQTRLDALPTSALLAHPNIVAVRETFFENGFAYLAAEYISGMSLEAALQQQQVQGYETLLLYLRQVAAALDFAHRKGVFHGDLKPADILIAEPSDGTTNGRVKVGGFGEQKLLTGAAATSHADQLALASIVHQSLAGHGAISSEEISNSLSPMVARVLQRAVAADPELRFQTSSDFIGALGIALAEGKAAIGQNSPTSVVSPEISPRDEPTSDRSPRTTQVRKQRGGMPIFKSLAFLVMLCVAAAAALIYFVRSNSGKLIPVQVVEINPPTTPAPANPVPTEKANSSPSQVPAPAAPPIVKKQATESNSTPPAVNGPGAQHATQSSRDEGADQRTKAVPRGYSNLPDPSGPGIASVDLVSEPMGAKLVVDGRGDATCTAPCTMSLPAGRHTLTAELNGYTVARRIFTLPETNRLLISLSGNNGTLLVTSNPTGAGIFVDGKSFGNTPATLHLPTGLHTLLVFSGSRQHEETVNIEPDTFQARAIRW